MVGLRLGVAVISSGLILGSAIAASADVYQITSAQAECLSRHADAYLAEEKPVYIIPVAVCPDTKASLADQAEASSASGDSNLLRGEGDGIVVLTPQQFRCLRDNLARLVRPVVGSDLVSLDMSSC